MIQLTWEGTEGYHAFAASLSNTWVYMPEPASRYVSMYTVEEVGVPSDGGITIHQMKASENYIEGNFELRPAGRVLDDRIAPVGNVTGRFRVCRYP